PGRAAQPKSAAPHAGGPRMTQPAADRGQRSGVAAIIGPGHTFATVTDKISAGGLTRETPRGWVVGFALAVPPLLALHFAVDVLFTKDIGIECVNTPVGWGVAIIKFVWWIGIGHAGTLISAILLLFRQERRTSINRFAEAMTLFAVACAALYPVLHLGR